MPDPKDQSSAPKKGDRIELREAVRVAMQYFLELLPQFRDANPLLEEVEESDDGSIWWITLGYDVRQQPSTLNPALQSIFSQQNPVVRKYKILKIEADTGRVVSMKIRSLD